MAFNFFSIQEKSDTYGGIQVTYPIAVPAGTGNGVIDVHGQMRWKNYGNVEEVPRLLLTEYSLDYSRWASNLTAITTALEQADKSGKADPYLKLYKGSPTKFYYSLPYLVKPGDSLRGTVTNEWQDLDTAGALGGILGGSAQGIISKIGAGVGAAAGQFSAGFGTEPLRTFKSTGDNKITISFPLYNTFSIEEANDNFSFVSLLAFQNLKTRTSFVSYLPPKIYTVDGLASGSVYMAAAYISELRIDSIGTTRCITDIGTAINGGAGNSNDRRTLIPEAYKVTITFTDILTQSSNVMWGALGGTKVSVIEPPDTSTASGAGTRGGSGPASPGNPNPAPILPPD